jgi:site-specific recombinase XerD
MAHPENDALEDLDMLVVADVDVTVVSSTGQGADETSELTPPSTALAPVLTPGELVTALEHLVERAEAYAADSRSSSTQRAYANDFKAFEVWCAKHGLSSTPATPATVAVYLSALADKGRKATSIERALAGIAWAQRARGFEWPKGHRAITQVMTGIRRQLGVAPAQKLAVVDEVLSALVATLDDSLIGKRDRALLTMGWFGAFRRSELVALTVADVMREREGMIVRVRRSKGDQEGKGAEKGIPYASHAPLCPVRSLDAWLEAAAITEGPLFRGIDPQGKVVEAGLHDRTVARIVQKTAERAGLDPKTFGGHSLRSGFATTAAKKGKSLDAIMRQTLHKSVEVARGYIRHAKMFDDNAAVGLL